MKTNDFFVSFPKSTLAALKAMLFGESGTDLSKIISDLSFGEENDLIAINVALTFKGIKPEIDKTPHYESNWNTITKYELIGYSQINQAVTATSYTSHYNKNEKTFNGWEEGGEVMMPLEKWYNLTTDVKECEKYIAECNE